MSIVQQIRTTLQKCGGPMTMDQLADANDWDQAQRNKAYIMMADYKKRGEIRTALEEGKVTYELVAGFEPKRPGTKPGRAIHVGRRDKTPKPAAAIARDFESARIDAAAQRARHETEASAAQELLERVPGGSLTGTKPRGDLDLCKRIDAIATDLEEALGDALDADHDKTFIKHLLAAATAVNRAVRSYPRI
jgi:hypothetical protein